MRTKISDKIIAICQEEDGVKCDECKCSEMECAEHLLLKIYIAAGIQEDENDEN